MFWKRKKQSMGICLNAHPDDASKSTVILTNVRFFRNLFVSPSSKSPVHLIKMSSQDSGVGFQTPLHGGQQNKNVLISVEPTESAPCAPGLQEPTPDIVQEPSPPSSTPGVVIEDDVMVGLGSPLQSPALYPDGDSRSLPAAPKALRNVDDSSKDRQHLDSDAIVPMEMDSSIITKFHECSSNSTASEINDSDEFDDVFDSSEDGAHKGKDYTHDTSVTDKLKMINEDQNDFCIPANYVDMKATTAALPSNSKLHTTKGIRNPQQPSRTRITTRSFRIESKVESKAMVNRSAGLGHLDQLCRLMEKLGELQDSNRRLRCQLHMLEDQLQTSQKQQALMSSQCSCGVAHILGLQSAGTSRVKKNSRTKSMMETKTTENMEMRPWRKKILPLRRKSCGLFLPNEEDFSIEEYSRTETEMGAVREISLEDNR
uniref:uncharacterized protein isoform X2 n=1 Tax=Myxine glutinosa TaxID=7769 RepID=UPI00358E6986